MSDQLHDRGRALEDSFFHDVDQKLLDELRHSLEAEKTRLALQAITGIENETALNKLVEAGISPASLTAFSIVPLVFVAWADGQVQSNERDAVLKAAVEAGMEPDSTGYKLISAWLKSKPEEQLLDAWKSYIGALKETLDHASYIHLKSNIMDRTRQVAASAGGFLKMGAISLSESKKIEELEAAF